MTETGAPPSAPPPPRRIHRLQTFVTTWAAWLLAAQCTVCLGLTLWYLYQHEQNLVVAQAEQHAQDYTRALAEIRTFYTTAVVEPMRARGVEVTHDFEHRPGSIPLPATFSMTIGSRLTGPESRVTTRLYSPYPFPWRRADGTGGLRDDFDREAWQNLTLNPDRPYKQLVDRGDQLVLRLATADRMRPACVNCHNSHPDSPKTGWKVGDVRGVLEVTVMLGGSLGRLRGGWGAPVVILMISSLAGLAALVLLVRRHAYQTTRGAEQLRVLVAALESSNESLDEFAYIASHDLKEPLRGIRNYARFVIEDSAHALDAEAKLRLKTIESLTGRMQALIDSLLTYSRVGRVELSMAETDLEEVLGEVLDSLAARIEELHVEVRRPRPLPKLVCDRVRIGEVFHNLIGNAMKYNDKSERWVEIGYEEQTRRYYVRDNGIGIPDKHHAIAFEMFKRLHGRSKFGEGTGAGLAIAKRIVERHGGRIWIESAQGKGTTFFFTLGKETS